MPLGFNPEELDGIARRTGQPLPSFATPDALASQMTAPRPDVPMMAPDMAPTAPGPLDLSKAAIEAPMGQAPPPPQTYVPNNVAPREGEIVTGPPISPTAPQPPMMSMPMGGGGRAGFVPASRQSVELGVDVAQPLAESQALGAQAVGSRTQADYVQAQANAARANAEAAQLEQQQREYADFSAHRDKELAKSKAFIDTASKEAEAAAADVKSPEKVWQSKSTGQKIAGMIAVALGGFVQGFRGTASNAGLDAINKQIADEVEAQRYKYMQAKDKKRDAMSAYGQAASMFGDDERRFLGAQMIARQATIGKLNAMAANATLDPEQKARADKMAADFARMQADDQLRLGQLTAKHVTETYQRPQAASLPGALKYDDGKGVRLPDGTTFYAADDKERGELKTATAGMLAMRENVAKVKELLGDPAAYTDGRLASARLALAKSAKTLGENSDKDFEALQEQTGLSGNIAALGVKQKLGLTRGLDQFFATQATRYQNQVRASNGTVVKEGFVRDPRTGLPQRVAIPVGKTTADWSLEGQSPTNETPAGVRRAGQ